MPRHTTTYWPSHFASVPRTGPAVTYWPSVAPVTVQLPTAATGAPPLIEANDHAAFTILEVESTGRLVEPPPNLRPEVHCEFVADGRLPARLMPTATVE